MTINSEIRKVGPFIGNGTASAFPFTFKVFQASDLEVVRLEVSTNVETVLTLNSQYTVTLNVDQDSNPGGTVTLIGGALASGYTLTLTSDVPYLQPTDLTNQGGFYPDVINDALDRATIQIQQLGVDVNRSIKVAVSSDVNTELPVPNANDLLGWDSTGDGLTNIDPGSLATIVAYATAYADTFNGNGSTTSWTLTRNPGTLYNLDVSINGVTQVPVTDYTLVGTTFTTTTPAPINSVILVKYKEGLANATVDAQDVRYVPASGPETDLQTRLREYDASNIATGLLTSRTKPTGFSYVPGNIFDCVTSGQAKHDIDLEWEFRTAYKSLMGPEYGPTWGFADTWVDPVNGNDANDGSFARPVKTIKKALQVTFGTIWLMPAIYTEKLDVRYSDRPGRAMMIKAWGEDGSAILYAAGQQPSAMTWTASGAGWAATPSGGETAELIIYNKNGKEYPIQYKTSVANVNAQGYGWYQNPTTKEIYMRYEGLDINANKADFEICYQTSGNRWFSGATIFFKGIKFRAGNQLDIVYQDTNRPRFYAQNCSFEYMAGSNVHTEGALIMTQNCTSRNALVSDGFNYYDSTAGYPSATTPGGVPTQAVEIDNVCINNGVPECMGFVNYPTNQDRNKQGSSGHQNTIVARINGEYYGNYGQNIADTGTGSKTWMVGTTCRNPENFYVAYPGTRSSTPNGYYDLWVEGTCYLDTVTAGGRLSTYGLWVNSGTSYVYRCAFSGTTANTGGTGTIVQQNTPT